MTALDRLLAECEKLDKAWNPTERCRCSSHAIQVGDCPHGEAKRNADFAARTALPKLAKIVRVLSTNICRYGHDGCTNGLCAGCRALAEAERIAGEQP